MLALILRHKAAAVPGIVILHQTLEPVLVGATPLSKVLLNDYEKGIRFYTFDRTTYTRKEKVVQPKDYDAFMKIATAYYSYAKMTLESVPYEENEKRVITVDGITFSLGEIIR